MAIYDLNIPWTPSTTQRELDETLRWVAHLGYDTVALNHVLHKVPEKIIHNPVAAVIRALQAGGPGGAGGSAVGATTTTTNTSALSTSRRRYPTRILSRATVIFSDTQQHYRLDQLLAAYDIVAVRPQNEKALQAACVTMGSGGSSKASIISLDFSQMLALRLRYKNAASAWNAGIHFELCYAQLLDLPEPALGSSLVSETGAVVAARCLAGWAQLFTVTRGRGIIVSSGATRKLSFRPPASIRNLLAVHGLASERALKAQVDSPRLVVMNDLLKRSGQGGVVSIIKTATKDTTAPAKKSSAALSQEANAVVLSKRQRKKLAFEEATKQKQKPVEHVTSEANGINPDAMSICEDDSGPQEPTSTPLALASGALSEATVVTSTTHGKRKPTGIAGDSAQQAPTPKKRMQKRP